MIPPKVVDFSSSSGLPESSSAADLYQYYHPFFPRYTVLIDGKFGTPTNINHSRVMVAVY
jgi:hypothetical protein